MFTIHLEEVVYFLGTIILQYKNRFIVCPNLRKYKNHIFFLKGLHGAFAYSLEFLIYKDGCLSGSNAFR